MLPNASILKLEKLVFSFFEFSWHLKILCSLYFSCNIFTFVFQIFYIF
ncbi:unnamed protein product, partial [Tenebrio molitor]